MSDDENGVGEEESAADDLLEEQAAGENSAADDWGDALAEQAESEAEGSAADDWGDALEEQAQSDGGDDLSRAEFADLNAQASTPGGGEDVNLDILLDVPVTISMEIGRTKINIRNLLHLNQGSVIELDRLAGEPMDVLVNGTLIAHGEVVVVNDKFGIRLTDVISPSERVKKLR